MSSVETKTLRKIKSLLQNKPNFPIFYANGHGNHAITGPLYLHEGQYIIYLVRPGCSLIGNSTAGYSKDMRKFLMQRQNVVDFLTGVKTIQPLPTVLKEFTGLHVHAGPGFAPDVGISLFSFSTNPAVPNSTIPKNVTKTSPLLTSANKGYSPVRSRRWYGMFGYTEKTKKLRPVIPFSKRFDAESLTTLIKRNKGIYIVSTCRSSKWNNRPASFKKTVTNRALLSPNIKTRKFNNITHNEANILENNLGNRNLHLGVKRLKTFASPQAVKAYAANIMKHITPKTANSISSANAMKASKRALTPIKI